MPSVHPAKDQAPSYPDNLLFSTTRLDKGHCLQSETQNYMVLILIELISKPYSVYIVIFIFTF